MDIADLGAERLVAQLRGKKLLENLMLGGGRQIINSKE